MLKKRTKLISAQGKVFSYFSNLQRKIKRFALLQNRRKGFNSMCLQKNFEHFFFN